MRTLQTPVARRSVFVVALLMMALAVPSVAAADPPVVTTGTFMELDQPNPCRPGETNDVTIDFTLKTHVHEHNTVRLLKTESRSDDGFVGNGVQAEVIGQRADRVVVKFINNHPDTGEKYSVTVRFVLDLATGELLSGSFKPAFRCIRDAN